MSDSNVYTAERILNKRTVNGVTQYFIKWKGYSSKDNTWEPVENILDRGLLTAFERNERKHSKKGKRNSTSSQNRSRGIVKNSTNNDDRENSNVSQQSASCSSSKLPTTPISAPSTPQHFSPLPNNSPNKSGQASPVATTANSIKTNNITGNAGADTSFRRSPTPSINIRPSTTPAHSPTVSKLPNKVAEPSPKVSTPTPPPNTSPARVVSPVKAEVKTTYAQVEPSFVESTELHFSTFNGSAMPIQISSTPLPNNNDVSHYQSSNNNNNNNNSSINNNNRIDNVSSAPKSKRLSSKLAMLNTVITDVTVNNQTITISESKSNQGFFREVSRHSVAVDTTQPGESTVNRD